MATARKKTTLYLDEKLMRTATLIATASGKHDYEVIEEALAEYVATRRDEARRQMIQLLDDLAARHDREGIPSLDDEEALAIAYQELHAMRAERDARA